MTNTFKSTVATSAFVSISSTPRGRPDRRAYVLRSGACTQPSHLAERLAQVPFARGQSRIRNTRQLDALGTALAGRPCIGRPPESPVSSCLTVVRRRRLRSHGPSDDSSRTGGCSTAVRHDTLESGHVEGP